MPPRGNGNRVSLSGVTLPAEQHERLLREEEERTIGKSKLVEKGLTLLFAELDAADKAPGVIGSVAAAAAVEKP